MRERERERERESERERERERERESTKLCINLEVKKSTFSLISTCILSNFGTCYLIMHRHF